MIEQDDDLIIKANLAHQRAMPMTRLLDCGMGNADATRLHISTSAGEPWDMVAEAIASERLSQADRAEADGNVVTAGEARQRGIAALVFAQMAFNFDEPRKVELYRQLVAACRKLAPVFDLPFERVETGFAEKCLVGWLVRPVGGKASGTVILFGGQSGWGIAYLPIARELARRGLATVLAEGPGQGETRIEQGLYLQAKVEAAFSRWVDFISSDPNLGIPGIWGNSYGGLWAARTASSDRRIRACCVNGSFARPGILPFRTAFEQSAAMVGTQDRATIEAIMESLHLSPERDRITCPLLVLHGGADPLVAMDDQQPFLDAADGEATLHVWPDGEHTIYNHSFERTSLVADWFAARLDGRLRGVGNNATFNEETLPGK
ncbi:alpha/beta hydrolase family protein [Agrobacterium tumefaciens]|uniref:Dipeptidyl aminopeptidase n=1 Tax=Agrobacterium tumefaciens TaxID=358 RepID=A0A2L2LM57_AGRTU|nr:alpha/beta hydrolase [Agrobacterium tumefaciens]AVH45415.1 dipeptidyl aminopeptidase [Agrobacterium tumefaciens]NSY99144.1 dipeptidyl aminopeptidase [Agrobacterium tumefaciens]